MMSTRYLVNSSTYQLINLEIAIIRQRPIRGHPVPSAWLYRL